MSKVSDNTLITVGSLTLTKEAMVDGVNERQMEKEFILCKVLTQKC
jgi:hypothetical protein